MRTDMLSYRTAVSLRVPLAISRMLSALVRGIPSREISTKSSATSCESATVSAFNSACARWDSSARIESSRLDACASSRITGAVIASAARATTCLLSMLSSVEERDDSLRRLASRKSAGGLQRQVHARLREQGHFTVKTGDATAVSVG